MKNICIAIEGPDGAGKTRFAKDLKEEINKAHPEIKVKNISLPHYGSFAYKKIRQILGSDLFFAYPPDVFQSLFIANMIDCAEGVINPFLEEEKENRIVILDRSLISTIIYNALSEGTIFSTMLDYSFKFCDGLVKNSITSKDVDFDILNKVYGHLIHPIDYTFFLLPPRRVIADHAKSRNSNEANDKEEAVLDAHKAYVEFYAYITDHYPRTIVNMLEQPDGVSKPNPKKIERFKKLTVWDSLLGDPGNYANWRKEVMSILNL